eukprot:COSAG02_NODE_17705_length_986_cov_1.217587_1_plen_131_part_00
MGRFLRTVKQNPSYVETALSLHLLIVDQIRALRLDNYEINAVDGVDLWDDGLDYSGHDLLDVVSCHLNHQFLQAVTIARHVGLTKFMFFATSFDRERPQQVSIRALWCTADADLQQRWPRNAFWWTGQPV